MKKKLAIIGAGEMQLPLVLKAKEMGLKTLCFAWAEGAICRDQCDKYYEVSILDRETILDICNKEKISGICTIASDAAVPTVSYVAEALGLVSNSFEHSGICTNKFAMRQQLEKYQVDMPGYVLAEIDAEPACDKLQFPLIVKPVDRSGSRGVVKINDHRNLPAAVLHACELSFVKQAIIEEFIAGIEVSVESISWEGKHYFITITDKVTSGDPYFVEIAHHQPSQFEGAIQKKLRSATVKALDALHVRYGASHSEFKIDETGKVYVIEIGARMGGDFIGSHLVHLSTGYDFLKGVIEVSLGYFNTPIIKSRKFSGIYFLCKETEHIKSIIENQTFPGMVMGSLTRNTLSNAHNSTDRSGYFIYQSKEKIELLKG